MSMTRWLSGPEDPRSAFGDSSIINDQFTDINLELPLLGRRQKASSHGCILYLVLLVAYAVVVVVAPWIFTPINQYYPAILCSCNVLLLAVTGLLQKHLSEQVKKERRQGFLKFSEHLKPLIHIPFTLLSYGTSGILLIVAWSSLLRALGVPVFLLIRLVILLEIASTGAIIALFLWRVHQHHLYHLQPDAINSLYSTVQPPTSLGDLRYLDGGRLAEQQALLLRYQQDNLRYLSEEILRLQESLSKYERSEDGTPQVDVVHILAAREQELRAVTAERDQLQSELRLARTLIAERDSNVAHIREVNDRYVEENERLRAMLGEWSARTAKVSRSHRSAKHPEVFQLEMALEAERLSNAELHKRVSILRHSNADSTGD